LPAQGQRAWYSFRKRAIELANVVMAALPMSAIQMVNGLLMSMLLN
jgi:hypothetical protein